jgi:hypothetical protein
LTGLSSTSRPAPPKTTICAPTTDDVCPSRWLGGSPEHMLQLVQKDIARWKKVIELQKITPQ